MHQSKSQPPPDADAGAAPTTSPGGSARPSQSMTRLVLDLIRPYRGWLIIVFVAMLIETAMSIAAPWPLKIILDNVVGKDKLPEYLGWLRDFSFGAIQCESDAWRMFRGASDPGRGFNAYDDHVGLS